MFKFYEDYQKLKKIRLKYQEFQFLTGRVLKVKNGRELYKLELDIMRNRLIHYNDGKKLLKLCDLKRTEFRLARELNKEKP